MPVEGLSCRSEGNMKLILFATEEELIELVNAYFDFLKAGNLFTSLSTLLTIFTTKISSVVLVIKKIIPNQLMLIYSSKVI
jgi:hypothetical protein